MGTIINQSKESRISGVSIIPLKQIEDERGAVLHMMRSDDVYFTQFGEIYFSEILPGQIKAWKRNKMKTQRFAVPFGKIHLVLCDQRNDSPTRGVMEEIVLGRPDQYYIVCIPPMVWYGFQGVSSVPALLANCADKPFDPEESEKLPVINDGIFYEWKDIS